MHKRSYIQEAQAKAEQMALNSSITHRHGCAAIRVRGKKRGEIVACGFNQSSLRGGTWFERGKPHEKVEEPANQRLFNSCRDVCIV